jgi:hypothetical protein
MAIQDEISKIFNELQRFRSAQRLPLPVGANNQPPQPVPLPQPELLQNQWPWFPSEPLGRQPLPPPPQQPPAQGDLWQRFYDLLKWLGIGTGWQPPATSPQGLGSVIMR